MMMKVEYIRPFLNAAVTVLQTETQSEVSKGKIGMADGPLVSDDVTVLVGVAGRVQGLVLYNLAERTARGLVSAMNGGTPVAIWDALAESGIAELGNVITGRASMALEAAGYHCNISPPTVVLGRGTQISTVHIRRLVIPLETRCGAITVHVALRED